MLLADLGADVVKIEPPVHGDRSRLTGPFRADDERRDYGGYFASVNRNKRSVVLDLKSERDRLALLELVPGADVVVENFTAGVMTRLGLGYDVLAEVNPTIVYATLRGFGDPELGASPYAGWPAFDVVAQAMGGFLSITGDVDGTPQKSGPGIGDLFPAALLGLGITAAVLHARESGHGQHVDVAMYDSILSLCERIVHQHSFTGAVPRPQGNGHPLLCPFDVFPARDGWVCIAAPGDEHWCRLCALMGMADLATDERYATGDARLAHADDVRSIVTSWTLRHTPTQIEEVLGGSVPFGPVQNVEQIFDDPHVAARQMLVSVDQPGSREPVVIAGQPLKFSRTPSGVYRRAPMLGEHSEEILETVSASRRTPS
jgi:crotonobetainyl-CoA:carnitine CoA-transferase CaiB-like acyl-CoA transferase